MTRRNFGMDIWKIIFACLVFATSAKCVSAEPSEVIVEFYSSSDLDKITKYKLLVFDEGRPQEKQLDTNSLSGWKSSMWGNCTVKGQQSVGGMTSGYLICRDKQNTVLAATSCSITKHRGAIINSETSNSSLSIGVSNQELYTFRLSCQ